MTPDQFSAADGFVIAMLAMIFMSMGVVALLFVCMRRNAARRDLEVDDLLDEVEETEKRGKQPAPEAPPAEPWERDGDWWKK